MSWNWFGIRRDQVGLILHDQGTGPLGDQHPVVVGERGRRVEYQHYEIGFCGSPPRSLDSGLFNRIIAFAPACRVGKFDGPAINRGKHGENIASRPWLVEYNRPLKAG